MGFEIDILDDEIWRKLPLIFALKELLEANKELINHSLKANGVWTNPLSEDFGPGRGPTSLDVWGLEFFTKEQKLDSKLD